jgi:hypothetical protein
MPVDEYQNADYKDADSRGRITLGKEYANSKIAVAWSEIEIPNTDDVVKPSKEERDKLTELHRWATENGYNALDFDVHRGRVYTQDAEWVDAEGVEGLLNDG